MRAVVAPMVADLTFYEAIPGLIERCSPALQKEVERLRFAPYEASLAAMRQVLPNWRFDASWCPAVAPDHPAPLQRRVHDRLRDLAREFGVGMHTHVAESKVQVIVGLKKYGKTRRPPTCRSSGCCGPDFIVAHGVWLDDDDIARLADHGASVAHNPGSNMLLGNGLADVRGMLDRKVNVGIGTDGASCSDNQNMYESLRLAAFGSNVQGPDVRRWLTTEEMLRGRHRRQRPRARLRRPDRQDRPGLQGRPRLRRPAPHQLDPVQRSDQPAGPHRGRHAVHSVMVGGRMIVENHKLLTVDLAALAAKAEESRAAAGEDHRARQEALRAAGEGRRHLLPRSRQGAAAHPSLWRQSSRTLRARATPTVLPAAAP